MDFLLKYQAEYEYSYVIYIGRSIKRKKFHILLRRTFSTRTETQRGKENRRYVGIRPRRMPVRYKRKIFLCDLCDLCVKEKFPPKAD